MMVSVTSGVGAAESRRARMREQPPPIVVASLVLLATWLLLMHLPLYTWGDPRGDTAIYRGWAVQALDGAVPYRDFVPVYPPGALVPFLAAGLGKPVEHVYLVRFEWLMALCALVTLAAIDVVLREAAVPPRRRLAVLVLVALSPLALGSIVMSRFDFWPAMLTVVALAALAKRRAAFAGASLGVAVAAKLYPVVIVPLVIVFLVRNRGRPAVIRFLASFAGAIAVLVLPFAAVAPGGTWSSVSIQFQRPLEFESTGASLLLVAHALSGLKLGLFWPYGAPSVGGLRGSLVADFFSVLEVVALLWIWWLAARRLTTFAQLLMGAAASVAVVLALGKMFSPQYLVWLIPLVPLLDGRLRIRALALLLVACALTQAYYPRDLLPLTTFHQRPVWILFARDLVVLALAALLASALAASYRRPTEPSPQSLGSILRRRVTPVPR